jgi:hypothetical protein
MNRTKPLLCPAIVLACLMIQPALAVGEPRLPSGPADVKRFGGYQTRLAFTPEWDAPWRIGPHADVVVAFADSPARLVFWHGANFVPCWVTETGQWFSDGAVQRPGAGPHQDRLCRFSFASVLETSPARVVVRWRYAPVDEKGELIHGDPVTRWHDWVDEFYTIYPDRSGVRSVTLHSSTWDQPVWVQQDIAIRHPGEPAPSAAATSKVIPLAGGVLEVSAGEGDLPFRVIPGQANRIEVPPSWGEWPVRGAAVRAGHQLRGGWQWEPAGQALTNKTWRMLVGLGSGDSAALTAVAQSWLAPPTVQVTGGGCTFEGFQADEKAYLFKAGRPGTPDGVRMTVAASPESPLVNPAFVVKGWGRVPVTIAVAGRQVPAGPDFRHGYRKTASGADLIVWLRTTATTPVPIAILTESSQHE